MLSCCWLISAHTAVWAQDLSHEFGGLLKSWQGPYGEGIFMESWRSLNPQQLEGRACYLLNGDTVVWEYLQIRTMGKHIGYLASVNGNPPVLFNLREQYQDGWKFENSEHDFPQSITYTLQSDGSLLVEVSGVQNGKERQDQYRLFAIKDP